MCNFVLLYIYIYMYIYIYIGLGSKTSVKDTCVVLSGENVSGGRGGGGGETKLRGQRRTRRAAKKLRGVDRRTISASFLAR